MPRLPSEWPTSKSKGVFGALVIFTVTDFKFWRICLVNITVGMGMCSLVSLRFTLELTERCVFARTPAGSLSSSDTRPSRRPQKFYVISSYVPFLLPTNCGKSFFLARFWGAVWSRNTKGLSVCTELNPHNSKRELPLNLSSDQCHWERLHHLLHQLLFRDSIGVMHFTMAAPEQLGNQFPEGLRHTN